jgi:hypothetical protein
MAPMSAPAAKAFSLPVSTMQPMAGSASKGLQRLAQFVHQLVVERIELLGPVQRDNTHLPALGAHGDHFVGHGGLHGLPGVAVAA